MTVRFYQRRGFVLVALRRSAVDESRKFKPEIPLLGMDGIPIRDEIELEMALEERLRDWKLGFGFLGFGIFSSLFCQNP